MKGSEDTMTVYSRDRPAVSLGRFRGIDDVRDTGISIVRRISGGGTIYSDTGQLTYSVIFRKELVPGHREESFRTICGGLVRMFGQLGIDASHKPVNDIIVNGRKISGSAQYRSRGSVIQHGTIILHADRAGFGRHLSSGKGPGWIISAEDVLGYVPERPDVIEALKDGFRGIFGEMTDGELTDAENEDIRILMEQGAWRQ
jgi:lipoate-protein ligase A